jgi:hypothetical protein
LVEELDFEIRGTSEGPGMGAITTGNKMR